MENDEVIKQIDNNMSPRNAENAFIVSLLFSKSIYRIILIANASSTTDEGDMSFNIYVPEINDGGIGNSTTFSPNDSRCFFR